MNQLCTVGRLCQDPQLRAINGKQVCTFNLASNTTQKGTDGKYIPVFYQVDVWGQRGETCAKYLKKGDQIGATGELIPQTFIGNDGQTRNKLKLIASGVTFIGSRSAENKQPEPAQKSTTANEDEGEDEDDLPF